MWNRLTLLGKFSGGLGRTYQLILSRKLYTDTIYPYPKHYMNNEIYPSYVAYRETWEEAPYEKESKTNAKWMMRIFWTMFFFQLFNDPGAVIGHYHLPDPTKWTDEELGIPPLEAGTYEEWLNSRGKEVKKEKYKIDPHNFGAPAKQF